MFNSKFWLLIFLLLFIMSSGCVATDYNIKTFNKYFHNKSFNYKIAINNLKYVEHSSDYTQYFESRVVKYALDCLQANRNFFINAEKKYNVSSYIILAVLTVESYCGHYIPKYNLGEVFKTLIDLKHNKSLRKKVYLKVKKKYPDIKKAWFNRRLERKCKWAEIQLKALKKIFIKYHVNIFNVRSSWAGAFGLPQFIPTTFLHYAIDGDNNGNIDLWSMPDAIFSIANYFRKNGWRKNLSEEKKLKVIFRYNHSKLYSKIILKLSEIYKQKRGRKTPSL